MDFINSTENNEQLFYKAIMLYSYVKPIIDKIQLEIKFTDNIDYDSNAVGLYYSKNNIHYIEIKTQIDELDILKTIIHELHHLRQYYNGMIFDNSKPYSERKHEIEADEVSSRILYKYLLLNP